MTQGLATWSSERKRLVLSGWSETLTLPDYGRFARDTTRIRDTPLQFFSRECYGLWLLKNSIFLKTAKIWGIQNV